MAKRKVDCKRKVYDNKMRRKLELEIRNWKLEIRNWKLEIRNWKLEIRNWKLEIRNWKLTEDRDCRLKTESVKYFLF